MYNENIPVINPEHLLTSACKLPYCKIDRDAFLRMQLKNKITLTQLEDALKNGTINAGISIDTLNILADGVINLETTKVTTLSALTGLPGGLTMMATIPADLVQFYAHIFRVAQKLAYIYGYQDIDLDDTTQNVLMIFLGTMFGVNVANAALAKFAAQNASKIGAKIAAKPLSKYAIYNIAKKVLASIGIKLTKATTGRAVTKVVPFVGSIISGGITVATFHPMSKKLKTELSKFASMSLMDIEKANKVADDILTGFEL